MTVVCDACKTENRDTAMFCRGCAGKLPGFAATGPAALAALGAPTSARQRPGATGGGPAPVELTRIWFGLGLLFALMAIAFTGWYAYVTRKVAPPPMQAAVAAPAPSAAPTLPLTLITPVEPVQTVQLPAAAPPPSASILQPKPEPVPALPAREQRRPVQTAAVTRTAAGDPRSSCSHLNFIAAARCEAAQCDKAEYSRHPRCAVVREDRRRDEARRNPLMAN